MTDHIPGPTRVCFPRHQQFGWLRLRIVNRNKPCFPFVRRLSRKTPEIGEIHFYRILVRSMLRARVSLIVALLVLPSCVSTRPAIYSDSNSVSRDDIQAAIQLMQQRCVHEGRGVFPVFRVDVDRSDRIFVHCGPHYGVADAPGALQFLV